MKVCADGNARGPAELRMAGKTLYVPSGEVCGRTVVVTGQWLRIATVKDEELVVGEAVPEPPRFIEEIRASGLHADIFSFAQRPPATTPQYDYPLEWDSLAVIRITSFADWWRKLSQESRRNVRLAAKGGVAVRLAPFNDDLVKGIHDIYNETPIRQGRPFWHFGKSLSVVRQENATYPERSDFLGAYLNEELIGFMKMIYVDDRASVIQILAKNAYREHRPANALMAAAVEHCEKKGMSLLVHGKYVYGRHRKSLLTEFKRRNGFEGMNVPRYFVALTRTGRWAIKCRVHTGMRDRIPGPVIHVLLTLRSRLYRLASARSWQASPTR